MSERLSWVATLIACAGLTLVMFSGCSHNPRKPPCASKCGMLLEDEGNGAMSCDYLQTAEDSMLEASDELKSFDPGLAKDAACKALFGWQIKLEPYDAVFDSNVIPGLPIAGTCDCGSKVVVLMRSDNWRRGSFPHEYFHMVLGCKSPEWWGPGDPEIHPGPGHEGWHNHGITDIIKDFRAGRR